MKTFPFPIALLLLLGIPCGPCHSKAQQPKPANGVGRNTTPAADPAERDVVVQGIVLDDHGQPFAGAFVSVVITSRRTAPDPLEGSTVAVEEANTRTDEGGAFRMSVRGIAAEDLGLDLLAKSENGAVGFMNLPLERTFHEVKISIPQVTTATVKLVGPNNEPLAGATVKVHGLRAPVVYYYWVVAPAKTLAWPVPYVTDDAGAFNFTSTRLISEVQFEIDDPRVARQRWTVPTADGAPIELRTKEPRIVKGTVVARDTKAPLPGVFVKLTSSEDDKFMGIVSTKTDSDGQFILRPFLGDKLTLGLTSGDAQYLPMQREIPWIDGTTTQRMYLALYQRGNEPLDGTTIDGKPASTIDVDYPSAPVTHSTPSEPLTAISPGVLIVRATLAGVEGSDPAQWARGLIAINPTTGSWDHLAENGREPRFSPDGKNVAVVAGDGYSTNLQILALDAPSKPRNILKNCRGASWLPTSDALVANIANRAPQDYHGQDYWPIGTDKAFVGLNGDIRQRIPVPSAYDIYDISRDGKLLSMHWDTHSSLTGAQLYIAAGDASGLKAIARKRSEYYWYPRFSPDGKKVVAKHLDAKTGLSSIRVLAIDGSGEQAISFAKEYWPVVACWSPDGNCIAIAACAADAFRGGSMLGKLFIVDSDGTRVREVALSNVSEAGIGISSLDWGIAPLMP